MYGVKNMTQKQYDRAIQIHADIEVIYELQDVLKNSKNGKFLSAIKVKKWDSSGRVVAYGDVLNHAKVPEHIMEKFEKILLEELDALKTEFNKLWKINFNWCAR